MSKIGQAAPSIQPIGSVTPAAKAVTSSVPESFFGRADWAEKVILNSQFFVRENGKVKNFGTEKDPIYYIIDPSQPARKGAPNQAERADQAPPSLESGFYKQLDSSIDIHGLGQITSEGMGYWMKVIADTIAVEKRPEVRDQLVKLFNGLMNGVKRMMGPQDSYGLPAWQGYINKAKDDIVIGGGSSSSATDADLYIAQALIKMYQLSDRGMIVSKANAEGQNDYGALAAKLISRIKSYNQANIFNHKNDKHILTVSEDWGGFDSERRITVNPSYIILDALHDIAEFDGQDRNFWLKLRKDSFDLLKQTYQKYGSFPDQMQATLSQDGQTFEFSEERDFRNLTLEERNDGIRCYGELGKSVLAFDDEQSDMPQELRITKDCRALIREIINKQRPELSAANRNWSKLNKYARKEISLPNYLLLAKAAGDTELVNSLASELQTKFQPTDNGYNFSEYSDLFNRYFENTIPVLSLSFLNGLNPDQKQTAKPRAYTAKIPMQSLLAKDRVLVMKYTSDIVRAEIQRIFDGKDQSVDKARTEMDILRLFYEYASNLELEGNREAAKTVYLAIYNKDVPALAKYLKGAGPDFISAPTFSSEEYMNSYQNKVLFKLRDGFNLGYIGLNINEGVAKAADLVNPLRKMNGPVQVANHDLSQIKETDIASLKKKMIAFLNLKNFEQVKSCAIQILEQAAYPADEDSASTMSCISDTIGILEGVLSQLGEYKKAVEIFEELLTKKNGSGGSQQENLHLHLAAANAYLNLSKNTESKAVNVDQAMSHLIKVQELYEISAKTRAAYTIGTNNWVVANKYGAPNEELEFGKYCETLGNFFELWQKPFLGSQIILGEPYSGKYYSAEQESADMVQELRSARTLHELDISSETAKLQTFMDKYRKVYKDSPYLANVQAQYLVGQVKRPPTYSAKEKVSLLEIRSQWVKSLDGTIKLLESALKIENDKFGYKITGSGGNRTLIINLVLNLIATYRERGTVKKLLARENIPDPLQKQEMFLAAWADINKALMINGGILAKKPNLAEDFTWVSSAGDDTKIGEVETPEVAKIIWEDRFSSVPEEEKEDLAVILTLQKAYSHMSFFEDSSAEYFDQSQGNLQNAEKILRSLLTRNNLVSADLELKKLFKLPIISPKRGELVYFNAGSALIQTKLLQSKVSSTKVEADKLLAEALGIGVFFSQCKLAGSNIVFNDVNGKQSELQIPELASVTANIPSRLSDRTMNLNGDLQYSLDALLSVYPKRSELALEELFNILNWYEVNQSIADKKNLEAMKRSILQQINEFMPTSPKVRASHAELCLFGRERDAVQAYALYDEAISLSGTDQASIQKYDLDKLICEVLIEDGDLHEKLIRKYPDKVRYYEHL
ncbi:MAG: hypothetical protein WC838_06065, partial [Candidatus Margulisiibacteriota bacterium]